MGEKKKKKKYLRVMHSESEMAQLYPTLCDPMDSNLYQAPPSTGFSRQEYWSGLLFPSPRDLPNAGITLAYLSSPALTATFFTTCAIRKAPLVHALLLLIVNSDIPQVKFYSLKCDRMA